jgi:hypothetical protein
LGCTFFAWLGHHWFVSFLAFRGMLGRLTASLFYFLRSILFYFLPLETILVLFCFAASGQRGHYYLTTSLTDDWLTILYEDMIKTGAPFFFSSLPCALVPYYIQFGSSLDFRIIVIYQSSSTDNVGICCQ